MINFRLQLIIFLLTSIQLTTHGYGFPNNCSNSNSSYWSTSIYISPSRRGVTYEPSTREHSLPRIGYSTYQGTYHPIYGSNYSPSSSTGSRPNRVRGYTIDGDSINTDGQGNPSDPSKGMWVDDYEYYFDPNSGYWYRTSNQGLSWQMWDRWAGLLGGWDWRNSKPYWGRDPGEDAIQYYKDKPVPIGDASIHMILEILLLYIGYNTLVKPSLKK